MGKPGVVHADAIIEINRTTIRSSCVVERGPYGQSVAV